MAGSADLTIPPARDFGWRLKPISTAHFGLDTRDNGQFTVTLNHALLRGVTAQMLAWWFQSFTRLRVRLEDVPGYEGQEVPAYLLWHPTDHVSATLTGPVTEHGGPIPGRSGIHIREAMQVPRYGTRFPVDAVLKVLYAGGGGWGMGKILPLLGPAMMLRIHFKDVVEGGVQRGVHYHYEVVIGVSGTGPIARFVNRRLTAAFGPEFFEAWQTHNVIEVGVFENFLPGLYDQRGVAGPLRFARSMDAAREYPTEQGGHDHALFETRRRALAAAADPYRAQGYDRPSFL